MTVFRRRRRGLRAVCDRGAIRLTTRRGSSWTEDDDAELRRRVASKQTIGQIAREMARTMDAIRGRAATLRITLRSSQRPWRDGVTRRQRPTDGEDGER